MKRVKLPFEVYYCFINYLYEVNEAVLVGTFRRREDAEDLVLKENLLIKERNKDSSIKSYNRAILLDTTRLTLEERLADLSDYLRREEVKV